MIARFSQCLVLFLSVFWIHALIGFFLASGSIEAIQGSFSDVLRTVTIQANGFRNLQPWLINSNNGEPLTVRKGIFLMGKLTETANCDELAIF